MRNKYKRSLLISLVGMGFWTSCSPQYFFGRKDVPSSDVKLYRKVNLACGQVDLSSSNLDNEKFRSILKCFNANHGIEPLHRLVASTSDQKLNAFLDFVNPILRDRKRLFEVQESYRLLAEKGIIQSLFKNSAKILRKKDWIQSSAIFLQKGFFGQEIDPDFLDLLRISAKEQTKEKFLRSLEFAIQFLNIEALGHLKLSLSGDSIERLLNQTKPLYYFFQPEVSLGFSQLILPVVREERLFPMYWDILGLREKKFESFKETVRSNVSLFTELFREQEDQDRTLFEDFAVAMRDLRGTPINCFKGLRRIPDASLHLMKEFVAHSNAPKEYVLREAPRKGRLWGWVCDYPPSLKTHHIVFQKLALRDQMERLTAILKILYSAGGSQKKKDPPVLKYLISLLADSDPNKKPCDGVYCLVPILQEITRMDLWDDFLLIATSFNWDDQRWFEKGVTYGVLPKNELRGRSPLQVFLGGVHRQEPENSAELLKSFGGLLLSEELLLKEVLNDLRTAYLLTAAHPFLNLFQDTLAYTTQNPEMLALVFELIRHPDFSIALDGLADLGESGALSDLIEGFLQLFQRFAYSGARWVDPTDLVPKEIPRLSPNHLHSLTKPDL